MNHTLSLLLGTLALGLAQSALAQVPGARLPGGTIVPNLGGIWERAEGTRFNPANQPPPFNAAYAARFVASSAARARGEVVADPTSGCLPPGMPRFMVASYPLEILQTAGQVTIIAEWSSQVRRLFTDGRKLPPADEVDITFNGYSVGHWEGQTLVVDTVGIRGDTSFDSTSLEHSGQLTIRERIRLTSPTTLEDVMTLTDPGAFTQPWVVTRHYKRGGPGLHIMEYVCQENNRDIIRPGQKRTQ